MLQGGNSNPYTPRFDRGGCGIGFVADQFGRASHAMLTLGTESLINMEHRGALNADARTGDGAGVLTPLPRRLLAREVERLIGRQVDPAVLGVGVFFLPAGAEAELQGRAEAAMARHGVTLLCWRPIPIAPEALGGQARASMPQLWHAIVARHRGACRRRDRPAVV